MDKHQIMIAQNLFRVFLFFSLSLSLTAQPKLPKEPNLPNVVGSEKKEDRDARGDTKEQKTVVQNLTLCDGRTVRGEGTILTEGIQFTHVREGIEYKKKLKMEEIESIRIETWELKQKKEEKKGISFEAMPKKIRIRARSGESYYKESGLADLKLLNLEIKNNNGTATLYSYWIDLRYPNGSWFSGLPAIKNDGLVRDDCLKDVVRLIEWE